ncbi:hypothetical protein CFAM422_001169 [Trichoderma lentiforme]|uniref:Uncharacterized protein n=1 Tax=Trichoderma lentiforme TaxID=1567552 RepID=A0A9P4XPS2_9HYPO|nr:hypothetical protein CFAM422_001169 [Trichoderma lentiforme]
MAASSFLAMADGWAFFFSGSDPGTAPSASRGDGDGRGPSAGSAADCEVLGDALAAGGEATQFAGLVIE